ncbi:MAG TPA: YeeE/YedE family protein [Chromatiales bacterium]|nr:YeeE/YedE family protein [Chromatiales bacterium]
MENFSPLASTLGGILIGLAVAGLFHFNGKILGISNILSELLNPQWHGKDWRATFLLGLLSGGALLLWLYPQALSSESPRALGVLVLAGLLVGYGSSLGRGCTSGHGICGITRLSPRSLTATAIFMTTGMITVYITNHVLGWANG